MRFAFQTDAEAAGWVFSNGPQYGSRDSPEGLRTSKSASKVHDDHRTDLNAPDVDSLLQAVNASEELWASQAASAHPDWQVFKDQQDADAAAVQAAKEKLLADQDAALHQQATELVAAAEAASNE